jgi:hypothetical protein
MNERVRTAACKPDIAIGYGNRVEVLGVAQCGGHFQFCDLPGGGVNHAQLPELVMWGLFIGFLPGYATDLIVTFAEA